MSFSYSGGVITQTGTDSDYSGLNGITGVTTTVLSAGSGTFQGVTLYTIDSSTRLVISGTLSHDPDSEILVMQINSSGRIITISGTYNYGSSQSFQGGAVYEAGCGIQILGYYTGSQRQFNDTIAGIYVSSSGTFNWKGANILSGRSIISAGALNIENARFIPRSTNSTGTKDYSPRIGFKGGSGSLDGLEVFGSNGHFFGVTLGATTFSTFRNIKVVGNGDFSSVLSPEPGAIGGQSFANDFLKVSNIPDLSVGNLFTAKAWQGRFLEVTNYEGGVNLKDELSDKTSTAAAALGTVLSLKQFSANFKDSAGLNIEGVKLYISEESDGNEPPTSVNTSFSAEDISYLESAQTFTLTSDVSGNTSTVELALFFGYKMSTGATMTENVRTKSGIKINQPI